MAVSAKMQALIDKIDAADAAHFVALRETTKKQAAERAKVQEKKRHHLILSRAAQAAARESRKAS